MRRLIQVYDEQCIRNVGAVLSVDFDDAIFLYNRFTDTQNMGLLKKIVRKHRRTKVSFYKINGMEFDLGHLLDDSTYFNLNGPDTLLNILVSMYVEKHHLKSFYLFTNNQQLIPLHDSQELITCCNFIHLSIEDIININGSKIVRTNLDKPDMEDKVMINNILNIFEIIKDDFHRWNRYISRLGPLISANLDKAYIPINKKVKAVLNDYISKELIRLGIMTPKGNRLFFSSRRCMRMLRTSGSWLEYYTYIHLKKSGFFNDVDMGVVVDFDGDQEATVDDRCEIDVLCLKGLKPVFISNKTGKIKQEALYEIVSHARMFGNKNGIPVLCMANKVKAINPGIYKKAQELGVRVIDYDDIYNDKVAERIIDIVNDKYRYK